MIGKVLIFLQRNKLILLLAIIALILRLAFLSPYLEDWDSVQFALALHYYSIIEQLPHAPGYPLYIILGKFFYFFFKDENQALTVLSALLGSLSILPLYFLAKKMFDLKTALLASILFILIPVHWTLSETALTNIPGLFFLLIFILLLYTQAKNSKSLVLISGLGGFILGMRFTEFPIIASLLTLIHLNKFNAKDAFFSFLAFLSGMALWVLPLVFISGPNQFVEAYNGIARYIFTHDTQISKAIPIKALLKSRLNDLWYLLQVGYTTPFILVGTLAFLKVLFHRSSIKEWRYQFLGIWFFSYAIPLIFIYNLEVPRYTLPLLPPLVIFTSSMLTCLIKKQKLFIIAPLILTIVITLQSWSQVTRFNQQTPPTIKSVLYVKEKFDPKRTVIIATYTYRQFQYYAPEFRSYYKDKVTNMKVLPGDTIIIDYLGSKKILEGITNLQTIEIKDFKGDKDIYTRIPAINLYILKGE